MRPTPTAGRTLRALALLLIALCWVASAACAPEEDVHDAPAAEASAPADTEAAQKALQNATKIKPPSAKTPIKTKALQPADKLGDKLTRLDPRSIVQAEPPKPFDPKTMPARQSPLADTKTYPFTAGQSVDHAIYKGVYAALTQLQTDLGGASADPEAKDAPPPPPPADRPKGTLLTLWHTSNVHGEREDCGCPKRPLGGLGRKATIIQQAATSGRALDKPDGQLIVDAGNLLFKNARDAQASPPRGEVAMIEAEAVIEAFNAIGCDAFLVGEYEIAAGIDRLTRLHKQAKFPWISANLKRAGAKELLFAPFVVTKAAGMTVAIVGVTGPKDPKADTLRAAGVDLDDPQAALLAQLPALRKAKPDVVVLLSNLGVSATQELVDAARAKGLEIHATVASNTRRSTFDPVWSDSGAPLVESGSRGKHLGRLDLHILDGKPTFKPTSDMTRKAIQDYLNAYRSLHNSRRTVATSASRATDPARIERLERSKRYTVERLDKVERALPANLDDERAAAKAKAKAPESWLHSQLVAVDKKIEEAPKVRAILDKHIKRVEAYTKANPDASAPAKVKPFKEAGAKASPMSVTKPALKPNTALPKLTRPPKP